MAGTGKTVAVSEWLECSDRSGSLSGVVWVSLAEEHNDIGTFWSALLASFDMPTPSALGAPEDSGSPWTGAEIVVRCLDRIAGSPILVLDDVHVIYDPLTLAGLTHLLEMLPVHVTVVLASRFPPAIPWHQLDLKGALVRIGSADLMFSKSDTRSLLAASGVHVHEDQLDVVTEICGGWAAMVRMTALLLATAEDSTGVLTSVAAMGDPAISDFLTGELLDTISDEHRDFLLRTAVPEELDADLATELAGPRASDLLTEVLDRQFPLLRTGSAGVETYRYHPLLRAHLKSELVRRIGSDGVRRLELQVGRWYAKLQEPLPAIRHLVASHDRYELSKCLLELGPKAVLGPRGRAFLRALDKAPPDLADDPLVHLLRSIHGIVHNALAEADAFLQAASNRSSSICPADLFDRLHRAIDIDIRARLGGDVMRDVIPAAVHDNREIEAYVAVQQAKLEFTTASEAEVDHQLHVALSKAEYAGCPGPHLEALTMLAIIDGVNDQFTSMGTRARTGARFAAAAGVTENGDYHRCAVMLRYFDFLTGTHSDGVIDDPVDLIVGPDGVAVPIAGWDWCALSALVRFPTSQDKPQAAQNIADATSAALRDAAVHPLSAPLVPFAIQALVATHELGLAQRIIEMANEVFGPRPECSVAGAILELARGRSRRCPGILDAVLSRPGLRLPTAIQAHLLRAIVRADSGHESGSFDDLETAVILAGPQHLVQPFLAIDGVVPLVDTHLGRFGRLDTFVEDIRIRPDALHYSTSIILTPAERRVLQHLPSPRTTQEIADSLFLSVNTVKTHLRGVYGKLGAASRRDAVTAARLAGLL
ncbi:LuxR C-terminal-related transcriptional regulator [Dietzia sp. NPDC055877]